MRLVIGVNTERKKTKQCEMNMHSKDSAAESNVIICVLHQCNVLINITYAVNCQLIELFDVYINNTTNLN